MRAPVPPASGILLAGGRSSRFGRDKLSAPYLGRPLVDHAAIALAEVAREVLVLVPPIGEPALSADLLARPSIRTVRDPEPFGGPLVALLAGLERAAEPFAIVAGGDMPSLVPNVLTSMLRNLDSAEEDVVVLAFRGRAQPLPIAVRLGSATQRIRRLLGSGERSLRALLVGPGVGAIPEIEWRALDPQASTLRDVDVPRDLAT